LNNNTPNTTLPILHKALYFIGIGGIGMSALAKYFHAQGYTVSGYDKTKTTLTESLEAMGIQIRYQENVETLPTTIDFVVYTPAIPAIHTELNFYKANNYPVLKRSEVLQFITANSFNIGIAGTHGKTTTTTMVAHILRDSNFGCNAFLGGIAANYNTNFWSSEKNVVVIEADEYDRSFLRLHPNIAVITSTDADHLDIYGTPQAVEEAFVQYTKQIKPQGLLICKYGLAPQQQFVADTIFTYHLNNANATVHATNIQVQQGSYTFNVVIQQQNIGSFTLNMGGLHNIENVLAAIAIAYYLEIPIPAIQQAVANFKGVKRRFEYVVKTNEQVLIDDYAHHPKELEALITGVKSLYPQQPITLVFQPHLYSRTNDLANQFAQVLSTVDEVILLPIYPARELPIAGVSSEVLAEKITITNKQVLSKDDLLQYIQHNKKPLLVMAGAGDIDVVIQQVKTIVAP
jgi:UDP-N-acetylmuramate--alanine ligase